MDWVVNFQRSIEHVARLQRFIGNDFVSMLPVSQLAPRLAQFHSKHPRTAKWKMKWRKR